MSSFDAAARKLASAPIPYPLEDLPTDRNEPAWGDIKTEYKLSLPEMVALKNYSAHQTARGPRKRDLDVEEILDRYETKRRRIEGKRPRRFLSHVSKSHAFSHVEAERRIRRGAGFFFPLLSLPDTFNCTAFAEDGPGEKLDENIFHHLYFMKQMKLLVDAALSAKIPIKQQVYWSKSGKWMSLDDGYGVGVEPDFCMTSVVDTEKLVPAESDGLKPPQSKYAVTVALEMKKTFIDSDQIEALDYGERLLCFQRGRRCAYSALFHCCEKDKTIRWLKIEESNGRFTTTVSRPASLAPHGQGQRQLLTIVTKSSAELGLDFPQIKASYTNELVVITSLLGEGATSTVYAATFQGYNGVLKCLKHGFDDLADHELLVLHHLQHNHVSGIPRHVTKVCNGVLFFGEEYTHVDSLDREKLCGLVDCLHAAHKAGVVHRDLRPDNIMQDCEGRTILIDWGFAHRKMPAGTIPEFRGTFRYASEEVLASAVSGEPREPQPKDDMASLARVVLSMSSPSLQDALAEMQATDLTAVQSFWAEKRKANPGHEWVFALTNSCGYDGLKSALFG